MRHPPDRGQLLEPLGGASETYCRASEAPVCPVLHTRAEADFDVNTKAEREIEAIGKLMGAVVSKTTAFLTSLAYLALRLNSKRWNVVCSLQSQPLNGSETNGG